MAESATITCVICSQKIKQEINFDVAPTNPMVEFSSENAVSITENPVACNKCKTVVDKTYQQSENIVHPPYIVKSEIKDEFLEGSTNTERIDEEHSSLRVDGCVLFHCYQCNYGANDKHILTDHVFGHRFKCNRCEYTTPNDCALMTHEQIHLYSERNACTDNIDERTSTLPKSEEKYRPLSQIYNLFECSDCHYSTSSCLTLKSHKKTCLFRQISKQVKTSKSKYLDELPFSTYRKSRSTDHMCVRNGTNFKCNLCDYQNKYSSRLKTHMLKHSDEHPFCCDKCDYKTYIKSNLTNHKLVHSDEKPLKCDLCDFTSKYSGNLKAHRNKHSVERNFCCDKCDYKTNCKGTLTVHKRIHSEGKPYKCDACDFTSKYLGNLKVHSNKHSGVHKFSCDKCDYKTYSRSNFTMHKIIHSEDKPFKCNLCSYRYKYSSCVKIHMFKHSGEQPFCCDECNYRTHSKYRLMNHKRIHSEEKPFNCSLCDFSSKHLASLKVHLSKHSSESFSSQK